MDIIGDSLDQMGLAHSRAAVNIQRVEFPGFLCRGERCTVGVAVFLADDEIVERVGCLAVRCGTALLHPGLHGMFRCRFGTDRRQFRRFAFRFFRKNRLMPRFQFKLHLLACRGFQPFGDDVSVIVAQPRFVNFVRNAQNDLSALHSYRHDPVKPLREKPFRYFCPYFRTCTAP